MESHALGYADVPGLPAPGVAGHAGRLGLGAWAGRRVLVCRGRVHGYEGHPVEAVTRLVHQLAEWGVRRLVLTNAAGGIHAELNPGDPMLIAAHLKLLGPADWRRPVSHSAPYSAAWREAAARGVPGVRSGTYAALTGPTYETPAEIRALAAMGADAVGMSTAREAEAAHALGMSVLGVSCVTNKGAGLGDGTLTHAEVEATGRRAAAKLARLVEAALTAGFQPPLPDPDPSPVLLPTPAPAFALASRPGTEYASLSEPNADPREDDTP